MQATNFITIQGWMRTDLNLKGNDLLVYAIIYGFSQAETQRFTGSLQYLADWCGATKQGILKNLQNLVNAGLIIKEDKYINNIKSVEYYTTEFNTPIKQSLTNNIDNNKSIETNTNVLVGNFEFGKPKAEKPKRESLYSKCVTMISEFTNDFGLFELLTSYLKMRLEIKDKPLYANQWKGMLNKLSTLADRPEDLYAIIQQSIDRGYLSFYPLSKQSSRNNFGEQGIVQSVVADNDRQKQQEEWRDEMKRQGKKVVF